MTGAVVWFTGLPRSGKTTLARRTHDALERCGVSAVLLDGDELRAALKPRPGYDPEGRAAFYATLANLAALLAQQGFVVLVAATAHRRSFREEARGLAARFVEVHVVTPLDECAGREPGGGLYGDPGARAELPGVGVAYEAPLEPEVVAHGGRDEVAVEHLVALLAPVH